LQATSVTVDGCRCEWFAHASFDVVVVQRATPLERIERLSNIVAII
jgi:hypothetical protein